ncbi:hypothetical protein VitviT2T_015783 [Vitis vinifera]|nr:hypothetical protein VitviT2T_015783 [Vitis vinifera]
MLLDLRPTSPLLRDVWLALERRFVDQSTAKEIQLKYDMQHHKKGKSNPRVRPKPLIPSNRLGLSPDVVPLQSIAPRPMGSRVERIPIDFLSLGGTPLIPEVTELSSLPKRAEVAMFASLMPATERAFTYTTSHSEWGSLLWFNVGYLSKELIYDHPLVTPLLDSEGILSTSFHQAILPALKGGKHQIPCLPPY